MKLIRLEAFPFLHAAEAKAYHVWAGVELTASQVQLHYRIAASTPEKFAQILFPEPSSKPARKDELWKETCFECFMPAKQGNAYLEFNGSPSGDWNWYALSDYRSGMHAVPVVSGLAPKQVSISRGEKEMDVKWILPFAGVKQGLLSGGAGSTELGNFGLTVVLSTRAATTYWAIQHLGVKPDFHLRASFTHDPFRN